MGKIGFYFDHFIRESGILLYIVILLGAILIIWLVWQKFKIKKVQSEFLQNRAFED
jgi:predicted negative regulator of RcsB-dependent stress response